MAAPLQSTSPTDSDDLETQAMVRRLQARLFDVEVEPVRVGRFELVRVIGSGGMGVVHLGRDDVLDRQVAIKLIRSERTQSEAARARLLREAQAMARLSHPNVVQVYEAGEHAGRVFVAMEFVEGTTLREWIDAVGGTRPWRERLRVLGAAGRGLAAAHRAGVVHRDFKPENVLLDAAGEPKVGDFGLAGVDGSRAVTLNDCSDGLVGPLTETGTVMGTPLYMAPEQLEAARVDARSDQFAFCVVAYELLVGHPPFAGESLAELTEQVTAGEVRPIPSNCSVPRWLLAVILRGLSVEPDRRWPSMEELLTAMAPRRRRLGIVAGVGLAGLGLAAGIAWASWSTSEPTSAPGSECERGRTELADAWGPERREAADRALRETKLPYAQDTFTRVATVLDDYARDWADGYYEICTARAAGEPVAAQTACLERARYELRLVTDELVAGQPVAVRHASDLVLSLPALERCRNPATAAVDAPSFDDPGVRKLVEGLGRASVLVESWRLPEAEAELRGLAADAAKLDQDSLGARVAVMRSQVAVTRGFYEEAARFAREALALAEHAENDELELLAWRRLAIASQKQGELSRAAFELERADTIAERTTSSAELRADLGNDRAMQLQLEGKLIESVAAYEDSLAAYRALSPEHPKIAGVLSDMALLLLRVGRQDAALEASEQALALQEQRVGPKHPSLVLFLSSVADQYMGAGRTADGLALRQRALALLEQEPEEHPEQQVVLAAVIGGDLVSLRRFDEAERMFDRAERTATERLPDDDPRLGPLANARGNFELDRRHYTEAVIYYERALTLTPNDATNHILMLGNLGLALARAGRIDEALERGEQLREAMQALAEGSPVRVCLTIGLAEVERLAGHDREAFAEFSRALKFEALEFPGEYRLLLYFGLARVEPDHTRARAHALEAQAIAAELPGFEPERSEIADWLEQHPE